MTTLSLPIGSWPPCSGQALRWQGCILLSLRLASGQKHQQKRLGLGRRFKNDSSSSERWQGVSLAAISEWWDVCKRISGRCSWLILKWVGGLNKDKVSNYSLEEISRLLWNKRLENLFFCKSGQIDFWPLFLVKSFNVLAEPKSNNGYQSRKLMQTNASDTATCYQLLFSVTGDVSRLPIE